MKTLINVVLATYLCIHFVLEREAGSLSSAISVTFALAVAAFLGYAMAKVNEAEKRSPK